MRLWECPSFRSTRWHAINTDLFADGDRGTILHTPTGETYNFIAAMGAYCIEILVPKEYLSTDLLSKIGFARRGVTP